MSMIDHHHHAGTSHTTVLDDRSGLGVAVAVIVALALVGLLVWLFAFSGVVFDRNDGGTNTRIEQRIQETDQGGSQTGPTQTSPAPQPS